MATKNSAGYKIVRGYLTKLSYEDVVLEPSQLIELKWPIGSSGQTKGKLQEYLNKKFKKYLDSVDSKQGVIVESIGEKGCWFIDLPHNDSFYFCFETEDFIKRQMKKSGCDVYATPFAS